MTSHVAGMWGALRHRVPETLPEPQRRRRRSARRPGWRRHRSAAILVGLGSAWYAWRAVELEAERRGQVAAGSDPETVLVFTILTGALSMAFGLSALAMGLRRHLHAAVPGLAAVLTAAASTLLAALLSADLQRPGLVAFLALVFGTNRLTRDALHLRPRHRAGTPAAGAIRKA